MTTRVTIKNEGPGVVKIDYVDLHPTLPEEKVQYMLVLSPSEETVASVYDTRKLVVREAP